MMTNDREFSAEEVLQGLKDFQRRTVEYVFSRFYGDNPTKRFLVADEVGLGKTMVAKGIVAKTIEYLQQQSQKRINIVYICSNAAIAAQNVKRLDLGGNRFAKATRLTYLPREVRDLQTHDVNFISLTPGTTFEHTRSRGGHKEERAILYHLLYDLPWAHGSKRKRYRTGLKNMLQATVGKESWRDLLDEAREWSLDETLAKAFRRAVLKSDDIYPLLKECAWSFRRYKEHIDSELNDERYRIIGELRSLLAKTCLDALEPDLVILDEFQRFKNLIDGDEDDLAAQLAKALFEQDENVRVLLLSATPYKMYTMYHEADNEDHYDDFMQTLKFLYDDTSEVEKVKKLLECYRIELISSNLEDTKLMEIKHQVERALLRVMCRTERTGSTQNNNAMLKEKIQYLKLHAVDLLHAVFYEKVANEVNARSTIEYWKSSPYLLNFMKDYELKKRFVEAMRNSEEKSLKKVVKNNKALLVDKSKISNYRKLDIPNPHMRQLLQDTIEKGMWRMLWMPPSMPYIKPQSIYKGKSEVSKALVFSSWNVVPDTIAALCSYEAERKMVKTYKSASEYRWYDNAPRLLDFKRDKDKGDLRGMPVLAWMLPFPTLARTIDPLSIVAEHGSALGIGEIKRLIKAQIEKLLEKLPKGEESTRIDERWYWAAPILFEEKVKFFSDWLEKKIISNTSEDDDQENITGEHLKYAMQVFQKDFSLGRRPDDLEDVLCDLVLAAPGICAYRALKRICLPRETEEFNETILDAAWEIAQGFRSLFNRPDSIAMLSGAKEWKSLPYWRKTLRYGIEGNIQALLDEYVHVLRDSLGFGQKDGSECMNGIAEHVREVLSLRAANIKVDILNDHMEKFDALNIRSHFALRFGDIRDDKDERVLRASNVRDAFNSPFRPFVLASTSVGQEGLDFHTWCHAIVHWNLPSNPVDLEQREGRVHRYKGYAVRKNIAHDFGLTALKEKDFVDPWDGMFELAKRKRNSTTNDLIPYWIYEGSDFSFKVERRVPILPFSKEEISYRYLKKSLSLYRLAFGQPRQEDLVAVLAEKNVLSNSKNISISLEPKR